ncbi:uncharacterized protein PADG_11332 [Paracoccidioides brasiliensis Pb18]|uniref:Uncharacterized protein n=1 Tax=Paracoccidioides brasiliensis (strain Pb18) TaxID=502780 RepID=A0A0A0HTG4_PARBD|nr:uncharacterized protein PADG_11332 [Paracoccidioides brasiliensis Pb18]KGM92509.1 hypothetical protein PADG_11332 [Paracoccidioides brasiliensis Pb18]
MVALSTVRIPRHTLIHRTSKSTGNTHTGLTIFNLCIAGTENSAFSTGKAETEIGTDGSISGILRGKFVILTLSDGEDGDGE